MTGTTRPEVDVVESGAPDRRDLLTPEQMDELRRDLEAEIEGEVRFDPVYRGLFATDASVYQIMPLGW